MSKAYWGLAEARYGGTISFGGRTTEALIELKLRDEQTATLAITPRVGEAFSVVFSWTWWEDKGEIWINAREIAGVPAQSVGALKAQRLKFTLTAREPLQLLGATGAVLEVDAIERDAAGQA